MITIKTLYQSARVRSLPLSVSGIVMGSALAFSKDAFKWEIFVWALLSAVLLQIVSDYANDYGDNQKGVDNDNRIGPKRAIQSGNMTPSELKKVVIGASILAFISILLLIWVAFGSENFVYSVFFLLLGGAAVISAIKYTVGKSAYGYLGLGDVFVFIFFGIVSVVGGYFLYKHEIEWKIFLPAISVGMLSVGVLNLNNLRDIINDRAMKKRTIPVLIGEELARYYHYILILMPMCLLLLYSLLTFQFGWKILYIIGFIPLIFHLLFIKRNQSPKGYDSQLKVVALSTFFISVLFFVGQVM